MKTRGRLKIWSALCAFSMAVMLMAGMTAEAAEAVTYKVTFRPGADATFDASELTGEYEVKEATGSIVYTVQAGESFPVAPRAVPGEGLYVLNDWNEEIAAAAGRAVEEDMEFVVRCGELVEAVEYVVRYVDEAGMDVATPVIAQTNLGEKVTAAAKTVADYQPDASGKEAVIDKEGVEIVFVYTSTLPENVVENIVDEYVDGGTVDEIRTETIYQDAPVAGGAAAGDGGAADDGAEVEIPDEEVPLADGEEDNTIDIPDEEVPLASGGNEEDTVEIEDEEVPLASGAEEGSGAVMWIAVAAAAAVVVLAAVWFITKRKRPADSGKKE